MKRSAWKTLGALLLSFAAVFSALEGLLMIVGVDPLGAQTSDVALLQAALAFVGIDLAIGLVLIGALIRRLREEERDVEGDVPAVSVLLPFWNEGLEGARATVNAWAAQRGLVHELLVGDDGSTEGTAPELAAALGLTAVSAQRWAGEVHGTPVQLFRFPHAGKGATLNSLAANARHGVLVTVDADTVPIDDSLRRLAAAFIKPEIDLATGVVSIANGRENWLTGNQSAEYLKNALVRIAWASLGGLDQLPGAFTGVRTDVFRAAGGFPEDSLTEDYELAYRVMAFGVRRGRPPEVACVLRAQVFTHGPSTTRGFIRQRTRWFAGFLTTLARFRSLIGDPRAGAYGLVRLPLKVIDAFLPALAFTSLVVLLRGGLLTALGVTRLSVTLFVVRWIWDLCVFGLALKASRRLGDHEAHVRASPPLHVAWALTAFEALTYVWLKHAAALRGTAWALGRMRQWEPSREQIVVTNGESTDSSLSAGERISRSEG